MSSLPLGFLSQSLGGGASYWAGVISGPTGSGCYALTTDSTNAIVISGYNLITATYSNSVYRITSAGSLALQRTISAGGNYGFGVGTDSSGNIFVGGLQTSSTKPTLFKVDKTTGAVTWQQVITTGFASGGINDLAVYQSNGNIYLANSTNGSKAIVQKADSTGAKVWGTARYDGMGNDKAYACALDSSENVIFGTNILDASTSYLEAGLIKFDSAGTMQWSRKLSYAANNYVSAFHPLAIDSTGAAIYAVGLNNGTYRNLHLYKVNSSGTQVWNRQLANASNNLTDFSVAVDSSDNVYVAGSDMTATNQWFVAKWNSSGTIQWQRKISTSVGITTPLIKIDSSGAVILSGNGGGGQMMVMRIPADGSLTGSFVLGSYTYTYAAGSLTESAGSAASFSAYSYTSFSDGTTFASGSDTSAALTNTYTLKALP